MAPPGERDVTATWVAGAVAYLTHAARSPLVRAHGAAGLAADDLREGAAADEVVELLDDVRARLDEALEIVGMLVAEVAGDPPEGGGPDAAGVVQAARAQVSDAGAGWTLTAGDGRTCERATVTAGRDLAATAVVVADLLGRFGVAVEVHVASAASGSAASGPGPSTARVDPSATRAADVSRTVPLDDPERSVRRLARACAELPAPRAVALALAIGRFAATGGRVQLVSDR